ncbi:hypothetical protein [Pseudomonas sp. FP603]|uniref:hypothetical protein n=1 Tax=Pseudomonas sp. FP603 TaxID=2954097 RepID=UPI00351E01FC
MSDNTLVALPWAPLAVQPSDVRGLPESERDALIISATQVDGQWVILSRYRDNVWQLEGFTSATCRRVIHGWTSAPRHRHFGR